MEYGIEKLRYSLLILTVTAGMMENALEKHVVRRTATTG